MFGERLTSNFDSGFIYMKGKNCYVGEVQKGKPHGKGKVLFFED